MPKPPSSPSTRKEVAARLRAQMPQIAERFVAAVRAVIPGAQGESRVVLIDSIPVFLAELADALEQPADEGQTREREAVMARLHGASRAKIPGYDLAQVVREYGVLRRLLIEVLEEQRPLDRSSLGFIDEIIERSVIQAVVEFTRERTLEEEQGRLATAQLAEQGRLYAAMLDATQDHIAAMDAALRFVYVNQATAAVLGRPRDEVLGHTPAELGMEPDFRAHFEANLRKALQGEHAGQETLFPSPSGLRLFEYRFSPLRAPDGSIPLAVMVTRDVDERGRAMRQLQEERDLREQFVFALTHDLRTPLTAAKATAELLLRHPERSERSVARINHALDRANRMIQDLLDSARIRAGQPLPIQVAPCDLRSIIEDVAEELAVVHGPRFVLELTGELVGDFSGPDLRRVVENLLTNAVKYGDPAAPITVRAARVGQRVRLEVHNEGPPIPPEDQARLFQSFVRTRAASTSGKSGWGIGLALVRAITDAHGGTVSARSTAAEGTTFTVELPG